MRTAQEIKNQLLETLAEVLDDPLKLVGFTRNKRSLVYARKVNDAEHRITFAIHCHPKYQPGAEAHIYPSVQVIMPQVSERALTLVKGDKMLLAGSPEIVIGQPIDFTAPKDKHQRWFATGDEQFIAACESIQAFLTRWVLPFLSEVSTPADLVKLYETDDARIVRSARGWSNWQHQPLSGDSLKMSQPTLRRRPRYVRCPEPSRLPISLNCSSQILMSSKGHNL